MRDVRPGQHRPRLDPAHPVAGAARRGARPAPGEGARRRRSPPSGSARAPTCWSPGSATGCKVDVERTSSEGPGITEVVLTTKSGDIKHHPRRRQAGLVHLPRPARPAGRAEAARRPRAARRGAAAPRRGRHLRRRPRKRLVKLDVTVDDAEVEVLPDADALAARGRRASSCPGSPAIQADGPGAVDRADRRHASPTRSTGPSRGSPDGPTVDWTRVDFWWGDERYVPADSTDRNDRRGRAATCSTASASTRRGCTRCRRPTTSIADVEAAAAAYDRRGAHARRRRLRPRAAGHGPRRPRRLAVPGLPAARRRRPDRRRRHRLPQAPARADLASPSPPSTGPARCGSSSPARARPTPSPAPSPTTAPSTRPPPAASPSRTRTWFLDQAAAGSL